MKVEDLIYELIDEENDSSLVKQYNSKEQDFSFETIYNSNDDNLLNEKYKEFKILLDCFQQNYRKLFAISVNEEEKKENRVKAKTYSEIGALYVNAIQNLYLNPINYRINQLNTNKSLKKANISINIGIFSIFISLLITIITTIWQCDSSKQQECTNAQRHTEITKQISTIQQQILIDNIQHNKIDTVIKQNSKIIENWKNK